MQATPADRSRLNRQRSSSWPPAQSTSGPLLFDPEYEHVTPSRSDSALSQLSGTAPTASGRLQTSSSACDHDVRDGGDSHGQSSADSSLTNATHQKPPSSRTDVVQNASGSELAVAGKLISSMDQATQTRLAVDVLAENDDGIQGLSSSQSLQEQVQSIINGLEQVALNRMSAIELRADAQEASRRIKNLHSRLATEVVPIFETVRARLGTSLDDDLRSLRQGMNSVEQLLDEIAASAKAFDKTQDRVQTMEWWILEREEGLYTPHVKDGSPAPMVDDLDEIVSELPSAPPSPFIEPEPEYLPSQRDTIDNGNVLSPVLGSISRDAIHGNPIVFTDSDILLDDYRKPSSVEEPTNISLPVSHPDEESVQYTAPALQSLRYLQKQQAHERLLRYGRNHNPEDMVYEGSQFDFVLDDPLPDMWDDGHPRDSDLINDTATTQNLMGFSKWASYGLPWRFQSKTTTGKWYPSYFLPVGRRFLCALILNNFEAIYLGMSFGARVSLLENKQEDVQATKTALINSWLWEPNCPVGDVDQPAITMPLPERPKKTVSAQASNTSENASKCERKRAPITPRPRPMHHRSMSTIIPLQWHSAANSPPTGNAAPSEEGAEGFDTALASDLNNALPAPEFTVTRRTSLP